MVVFEQLSRGQDTNDLPDFLGVAAAAEANLAQFKPQPPFDFRFRWPGMAVAAQVRASRTGPTLRLSGDLGAVPFSAEGAAERHKLFELMQWSDRHGACRFLVDQGQHLILLGDVSLSLPLTGAGVIAAAVEFLLRARPYLALAAEQRRGDTP